METLNFPLILFVLTVATGAVWVYEFFFARKKREKGAPVPWYLDYPASFFPVLLIVFALRSFVVEPFQIPSSSMRPTLVVGDFILVNKFSYGFRLPLLDTKIIPWGEPHRGDVVVFRYPFNPKVDYIKRVIGVPGDTVEYRNKKLTINGRVIADKADGGFDYLETQRDGSSRFEAMNEYIETIPTGKKGKDAEKSFHIGQDSQYPPIFLSQVMHFPNDDACVYFGSGENTGFSCKVPKGYYWMMGDNRDRSEDSRYWGFVPESYLRGRAFFIWFNWEDLKTFAFKRIGSLID